MSEFILNMPRRRAAPGARNHAFYSLDMFARGFVEAMFFTNGDIGDEKRPDLLNDMGVERLTRDAVEAIKADCAAFYQANRADIEAAQALEPGAAEGLRYGRESLDDTRCGHFFWYARQGHGVAWTDDALPQSHGGPACLYRLQDASRAFGESYVEHWRGWIHFRSSARAKQ